MQYTSGVAHHVVYLLPILAVVGVGLYRWRSLRPPRVTYVLFWRMLIVGLMMWLAGESLRILSIFSNIESLRVATVAAYVAFPLVVMIGVVRSTSSSITRERRLQAWLDGIVTAACTVVVSLQATEVRLTDIDLVGGLFVAMVTVDFMLVMMVIAMIMSRRSTRNGVIQTAALGLIAYTLTDLSTSINYAETTPLDNIIDLGYGVAALLMLSALIRVPQDPRHSMLTDLELATQDIGLPLVVLMPVPVLALAFLEWSREGSISVVPALLTGVLMTLLVIRLVLSLKENRYFVRQLEVMVEERKREALTDALTGVSNRRHGEILLQDAISALEPELFVGVMIVDVDHFKSINDQHGHEVGDEALRMIAKTITHAISASDFVCRFGGEEFVIGCAGIEAENRLMEIAERVRVHIERSQYSIGNGSFAKPTCSIGVALASPDANMEQVLHDADEALYVAKRTGRNRVVAAFATPAQPTTDDTLIEKMNALANAVQTLAPLYSPATTSTETCWTIVSKLETTAQTCDQLAIQLRSELGNDTARDANPAA